MEENILAKRFLSVLFVIFIFSIVSCEEKKMFTQEQAETIAFKRLQKYADEEHIPIKNFSPSPLQENHYYDKVEAWGIYYISETKPRHRVYIYVDRFGDTELHREIEPREK